MSIHIISDFICLYFPPIRKELIFVKTESLLVIFISAEDIIILKCKVLMPFGMDPLKNQGNCGLALWNLRLSWRLVFVFTTV